MMGECSVQERPGHKVRPYRLNPMRKPAYSFARVM
jgi:hypothetical protein